MKRDVKIYEIKDGRKKLAFKCYELPDSSNESIYYEICFCFNNGMEYKTPPTFKRTTENTIFVKTEVGEYWVQCFRAQSEYKRAV